MLQTVNTQNKFLLFICKSPGFSILDILRLPFGDRPPDLVLSGLSTTLSLLPDLLLSPLSGDLSNLSFSPFSLFADFSLSFVLEESLVLGRSRRFSRLSLLSLSCSLSLSWSGLISSLSSLGDDVLDFSSLINEKKKIKKVDSNLHTLMICHKVNNDNNKYVSAPHFKVYFTFIYIVKTLLLKQFYCFKGCVVMR